MLFYLSALAAGPSDSASKHVRCLNGTLPPSVEGVVIATCILSMIGAALIVLSYVLIREIRTRAREILVHLSLMDFMYATANLVGIAINFEQYADNDWAGHSVMRKVCITQAAFASFGTTASVFWTIALAAYVYLIVVLPVKNIGKYSMIAFYFICYGLAFIVMLWFALGRKLGFTKYGGSGWCSILLYDKFHKYQPLNNTFGSDLWIYLAILLVPTIFIALRFHLRYQVKSSKAILTRNTLSSVQSMEIKLMLIPVIFIFLRIWSLVFVFIVNNLRYEKLPCGWVLFFVHINGIGDSGQGFANAILFVVFTPKVRRHFIRLLLCYKCWAHRRREDISINTAAAAGGRRNDRYYGSVTSTDDEVRRDFSETTQDGRDARSLLLNTSQ